MEYHRNIDSLGAYFNVAPRNTLVDIHRFDDNSYETAVELAPAAHDFYRISFVHNQTEAATDDRSGDAHAAIYFTRPGRQYHCTHETPPQGFQLLLDEEIYRSHLTQASIEAYSFFSLDTATPLWLTEPEAVRVRSVLEQAYLELRNHSDEFAVPIVLSYVGVLLSTCERISRRQVASELPRDNELTAEFVKQLRLHYSDLSRRLPKPSVGHFAGQLNVTPGHLSDAVRQCRGTSALHLIHEHIIEEAQILLLSSGRSVSEIAYVLGFDYPSYFARLFKKKTGISPTGFRRSAKSV